ncbi:type II CAAX endopeptidase family protein [Aneurinibacillus sp. Ricciae_BoGa-3]|uniref:CPBP family intramembrane glutamic endopeptidase n=1 Tax=Aneurinibacillus sp. Ricciae_BoGa-3 TaxID=3022697 RepID=UPI00233FD91A|nr:type II CAAX endopeptidase family protein [Aneurinibacillus sp. Ricciae_BoGa-3]WCK54605.1 type II CAAX endopeptidase family protein [Aneurinibacillus sp. Ricciae_BoGa-3]
MYINKRWNRIALITGILLVLGYASSIGVQFSSLMWVATAKGNWKVQSSEHMNGTGVVLLIITAILSTLPALLFIPSYIRSRKGKWLDLAEGVSLRDAVYYFAFYQIGYALIQLVYIVMETFHLDHALSDQSIGGLLSSFLPQFMMAAAGLLIFRGRLGDIGFVRPVKIGQLLGAVVVCYLFTAFVLDFIVTVPLSHLFHLELDSWREQQISGQVAQAKNMNLITGIVEVLLVGLFVPIAEEIMFRGALQTALVQQFGPFFGILGSSLIFGIIHVDPVLFMPLFSMALILGWLRHHYKSLWASILFHALNNTITVCLYFFR